MKSFGFTLANGAAADKVIALNPAFFPTQKNVITQDADTKVVSAVDVVYTDKTALVAAGFSGVAAVVDDGTIDTNIVVSPLVSDRKVRPFMRSILTNGIIVKKMVIESNNIDQYQKTLEVTRVSGESVGEKKVIRLSDYFRAAQFQTGKIEVDFGAGVEFTDDTVWLMTFAASRTTSVTLFWD
jgi:hypothetical protein